MLQTVSKDTWGSHCFILKKKYIAWIYFAFKETCCYFDVFSSIFEIKSFNSCIALVGGHF
jgi:hypothetical protein